MPSILSRATKTLLVPHSQAQALWPNAPTLQRNGTLFSLLPHDPRTHIALRAANIEAPAPILYHYDWPSADGAKPFEVQKATAALATSHQRSYILNDLGTGKTKAALWAWHYLYRTGVAKKLLVVAPLSTLKFVWARELMMTLPDIKTVVLHGSRAQRQKLLAIDADVYIINHDGLKTVVTDLYKRADIDSMIIDELAVYRNNSQRSKRMREFVKRFAWVTGLTGRPCPQSPTDVWGQCKIITPQTVPKFFRHAQSALMLQVSEYRWVPREGALETALNWMTPHVRFSLDDVVELPEAIYRTVEVEMSAEQLVAYKKLSTEFAVMVQERRITAANAGVALGKLLQVACGYVYTENPNHVVLDSAPRQQMLLELIAEASEKVIVFAPFRHLIAGLSTLFTNNDIEFAVMHGDTKNREELFNLFQNTDKFHVLLAHPGTMAHGITLHRASTIIWYSPIPSLDIYQQSNARIRRVGQSKKQLYLHLQGSAVERRIYNLLQQKAKVQDEFLEMLQNGAAT